MGISPELKKDIENLFNTSESSDPIETIEEIVQNSEKLYLKSSLINNLPTYGSNANNSDEDECLSNVNKIPCGSNREKVWEGSSSLVDEKSDYGENSKEEVLFNDSLLQSSCMINTTVESQEDSTKWKDNIPKSSLIDSIQELNVTKTESVGENPINELLNIDISLGHVYDNGNTTHNTIYDDSNHAEIYTYTPKEGISAEDFVNFLNKFEIENNKFIPLQYDNVYRHYGSKIGSKIYLDEWEVIHIFNSSCVEIAVKNLNILKIHLLATKVENTVISKREINIKAISRTHEELFYKVYFNLKEKYNILDSQIYLRTKDFNRKEAIGIPIIFVDFKEPEFIKQENVVYVVLNETDFVCFSVENILLDLETPEKLIKKE